MRQKVFFLKCSDMPVWIHFIYLRSILENVFCLKCSQTPCLELPSWYFYLCHKDAVSHNKQIGCNFKSWFLKILCGLWPTPIVLLPVAPARNLCSDQKTHWWQSLRFPRMSKTTLEMLVVFTVLTKEHPSNELPKRNCSLKKDAEASSVGRGLGQESHGSKCLSHDASWTHRWRGLGGLPVSPSLMLHNACASTFFMRWAWDQSWRMK